MQDKHIEKRKRKGKYGKLMELQEEKKNTGMWNETQAEETIVGGKMRPYSRVVLRCHTMFLPLAL